MFKSRLAYCCLIVLIVLMVFFPLSHVKSQGSPTIAIDNGVVQIALGVYMTNSYMGNWIYRGKSQLGYGGEFFAVGNCSQAVTSNSLSTSVLEEFPSPAGETNTWYGCKLLINYTGFPLMQITRQVYVPAEASYFFINYNITNIGDTSTPQGKFFQAIDFNLNQSATTNEGGYMPSIDAVITQDGSSIWAGFKCYSMNSSDHGVYMEMVETPQPAHDIQRCTLNNRNDWATPSGITNDLKLALATAQGMNLSPGESINISFNIAFADTETELQTFLNSEPPTPQQKHQLELLDVGTSKTMTRMGNPLLINVQVRNTGDFSENFKVTTYAGNTVIGTKLVALDAHSTMTVTFLWQTTGFMPAIYKIHSTITPLTDGMQIVNNGMSDNEPVNLMGEGCCIVVAGDRSDHELIGVINDGSNRVYKILREVGYSSSDIYLMHQPGYNPQDVDDDGQNDVDNNATSANLQWAIESWAEHRVSPTAPLFIYLFDHGGNNAFKIRGSENLLASQLATWINNLESATNTSVHVIYAACQSGSFIDDLSAAGRIIITSSRANQSSYVGPDNVWESFSIPFWNSIKSGHCIMDAFNHACDIMDSQIQTPLLDDNGDSVGHTGCLPNNGDGAARAVFTYIGRCEWPFPWISHAVAKQTFTWPPPSSITLWSQIENRTSLTSVTACMQPPDWDPPVSNDTLDVTGFECFEMEDPEHDGNWTVSIPAVNFTNHASGPGNFIFFVMAEEKSGDAATPCVVEVEFTTLGDSSNDTQAPHLNVERPLGETVVYDAICVNGTVSDDTCLRKVELYVDGNLGDSLDLQPYSTSYFAFNLNTTLFENGAREILVKAYDTSGNCANQSMIVYVNNFVHDIIVADVAFLQTPVNQGEDINVNVTVANHGSYSETLNLTLYANTNPVASQILTLQPGEFNKVPFGWNTTGFVNGNYTLSAYAWPVTDETDTTNNNLTLTEQPITIIPEFPSLIATPLFMTATMLAVIAYRRKRRESFRM